MDGDRLVASTVAINKVLADMRDAIDANKFIHINRSKNIRTLAMLGLTWEDVKAEIYTLTELDYYCGPMLDYDAPTSDHFWEFKKNLCGQTIYIKFKVLYKKTMN